MIKFEKREDLLCLLSEDFYQYYRHSRNDRYERLTKATEVNSAVKGMFLEMQKMLQECNHGIVLKNFGVIAPKESVNEDKTSVFKVKYKKRGTYLVFLENEYLNYHYRTLLPHRYFKEDGQVLEIKKPRPHAVILHRKKLRQNKTRDDQD